MNLPPSDQDDDTRWRTNLVVFVAAVALVVVTVILMLMLKHGIAVQDCFAAGHHNCAPIDTTEQH